MGISSMNPHLPMRHSTALGPSDSACFAQVLQRGLPRPKTLDSLPAVRPEASLQSLALKEAAEALLQNELVLLLQHDAAKYPIKVGHAVEALINIAFAVLL
jgi:hypothetical protein